MHIEEAIQNLFPIRQIRNACLTKKDCGDDSRMVFYMTSTCVTPSSMVIQISPAITLWKAHTRSYPLSTLVVKNIGYTQEKLKLLQILPLKK